MSTFISRCYSDAAFQREYVRKIEFGNIVSVYVTRGRRSVRGHRHQNEAAHREAVEERRRFIRMEPAEPERRGWWTPAVHPNPCHQLVSYFVQNVVYRDMKLNHVIIN